MSARRTVVTRYTPDDFVGTDYIVATLGVCRETAQKWCRDKAVPGLLPPIGGGRHRINRREFDAAVAAGWTGARP